MTTNPLPTIRRMNLADLDQVILLDHASFSLPWPESSFRFELLENDVSRCWVSELQGKIVALLVLWLIVDEVHIATFSVDASLRQQGVGSRLLAHALIETCLEGGVKSFLEVRAGNIGAIALYRKFGYVEDGIRKKYYKDNGEDALMMTLEKIDLHLLESLR